jgi:hypothetical protein
MKKQPDLETIRRLRLGDLRRLLRHRYGHILPDDDAGRADLYELLLPVSLGPRSPSRLMRNVIETWAPWMPKAEAEQLVEQIERTPPTLRKRTGKDLGQLLGLTHAERERLRLWTIQAVDMTNEEMAAHRRRKRNLRREQKRRQQGIRSRTAYLATSLTKLKPWEKDGIHRRTWERRRKRLTQSLSQVVAQLNSCKGGTRLAARQQAEGHGKSGPVSVRGKIEQNDGKGVMLRLRRHGH